MEGLDMLAAIATQELHSSGSSASPSSGVVRREKRTRRGLAAAAADSLAQEDNDGGESGSNGRNVILSRKVAAETETVTIKQISNMSGINKVIR